MQTTNKKTTATKVKSKEKSTKDDIFATVTKKTHEDKLKKSVYSVSTPRNFVQKSSTVDIYAQKKIGLQATKTPKKVPGTTNKSGDVSPMKNLLRLSTSSVSQISTSSKIKNGQITKNDAKISNASKHATPRTARDLPFVNVTVNSPVLKKKLNQDGGKLNEKNGGKPLEEVNNKSSKFDSKDVEERQRSKTRTLNENEVKVLRSVEGVDNNAEMHNLSRKLTAKPKAFYVNLDESKDEPQNDKASEDDVSYEDDFESYESDFDSYHESPSDRSEQSNDRTHETSDEQSDDDNKFDSNDDKNIKTEEVSKEVKDEEKMLDSGNFDLRDSRSANKTKPMQFILEDMEPDVKSSLTDEGFQDMSSSGSSIKTVHTEVLDRPLFIDFTKSKESKRKRKVFDRLKQRAKDILSMVTLHEMSYSLFEMKPIPYDLYMATFGRSNYMQTAVQTFDDGITEEIQTEEIQVEDKWTQLPIKFSNHNLHLETNNKNRKTNTNNIEDYATKFNFFITNKTDVDVKNQNILEENYKSNPLRVYIEQKDGVGSTELLPYEIYRTKLKNTNFNNIRLEKFLKKNESRISRILSTTVSSNSIDLVKTSKYPFSKGYVAITTKYITNENIQFIKQAKIKAVVISETKSNLIFTIHNKCPNVIENKYAICLWDVSVAMREPVKILVAIDSINIARYRGSTDGVFVAALEDGSLHLWDLSEEPTWHPDINNDERPTDPVVVDNEALTQIERDREWNAKNSHIGLNNVTTRCLLQACAYTTSATSMYSGPCASVTGLVLETGTIQPQEGGRKVLGQVSALQRVGIITIWSIVQEKLKTSSDKGKAYWSKMKLEKKQIISLAEQLRLQTFNPVENFESTTFNLDAVKRRMSLRKKEKSLKRQYSRPKSDVSFDSDRPSSAAIRKNNEMIPVYSWQDGLVCTDLKVMRLNNNDIYLVGKNCGEVLCCTKNVGVFKINRLGVATDLSTVTCVEVSPHCLPYFLAATDGGTVNLCSLTDYRVLLTLDCRNGPPNQDMERYQVDTKGRFLGSTRPTTATSTMRPAAGVCVKSVFWCKSNPCCILSLQASGALLTWELTHSDINATSAVEHAASNATCSNNTLALLISDSSEVQIHSLHSDRRDQQQLRLFQKYAALL